jgi:hypothetical protein
VNSTETALWNEQGHAGALLAQQLADAAAPLALAHDMVSLSVLAGRYEQQPGIASVRLYGGNHELLAETGSSGNDGRLFPARVQLQQQALGEVELRLLPPSRSQIVRLSLGNIGLSALLHLLILGVAVLRPRTAPAGHAVRRQDTPAPAPVARTPEPPAAATTPETVTLLHIALEDPNGLLGRVSASMADELLSLFDQFIDRAARLYGGDVTTPFSPDGVLLRFTQDDADEREFHAIAAAQLFLQLVADSMEERREHGRLCLAGKAGVLHEGNDEAGVAMLARMAPAGRILSSPPASALSTRCRLGVSYRLAVREDTALQVALVESLAPEYQQLILNQSQKILGPTEAA